MNFRCAICHTQIKPFISFGQQPIANGFLNEAEFEEEFFFELQVCLCPGCAMVQLAEQPDRQQMFNENYAFFSGTSKFMGIHFQKFAESVRKDYLAGGDPFVVEIGSNDGIMLKNFMAAGIRHLGIEPSANVAEVAMQKGINTIVEFFDTEVAQNIVKAHGQADAILAANVMCHIPDLPSVLDGFKVLLKPMGIAAFEDPYLGDVIEKTSYDQIYDEHMYLFSASAIARLAARHDLQLIDAIPQETHGGSMRYVLGHKGARPVSSRAEDLIQHEEAQGLLQPETFDNFRENCEQSRDDLISILTNLKSQNRRVVGYAATSKSTTVINYCGITPELIEFISDTTPIKQGKFSPGKHIPVLGHQKFTEDYPDIALLFAWNHKKEILANEQAFVAAGGQWLEFVPRVRIL